MTLTHITLFLAAGVLSCATAFAQVPAAAPAGSTGLCKDGSYTSDATKKGACRGHKGVKDWYAPAAGTAATTAVAPASATPAAASVAPVKAAAKTVAPVTAPAAGGGPGQVWVNAGSKVYHCPGSKYYGKTKQGQYMTEAAAKAAGNHADHGKACAAS